MSDVRKTNVIEAVLLNQQGYSEKMRLLIVGKGFELTFSIVSRQYFPHPVS